MLRTALRTLSLPMLAAIATALILFVPTALAGSGVGAVFNLGQVNPVDATSTLKGTSAGAQLQVMNASSAAGAFSLYGVLTQAAPGADSAAVRGVNSGTGTAGSGLWGTHQGAGRGVYGTAATGAGIGVYGRHTGSSGTGPGVRGQSVSAAGPGVLGVNRAGGPGLSAVVSAGTPPLQVNSATKVPNLNADLLDGFHAAGFWQLGGNAATTPGTDFLGTSDNQALELKVNGARALRLEPDALSPNLIGGFSDNSVAPGVVAATIAGGGATGSANLVTDNFGSVGGGEGNRAGSSDGNPTDAQGTTVAGGFSNTASGLVSAVAGGNSNTAGGLASAVAGGASNTASGGSSAVAGGFNNTASGNFAAVAGGAFNTASGNLSFAAGNRAKATQPGAFVWGDSTNADVTSPAADTFTVRASGGTFIQGSANVTGGALSTGIVTFADGDATPSVAGGNVFKANSTAPTLITDLTGGTAGQTITIVFANSNTDVQDIGNLHLSGTFTPNADSTLALVTTDGTNWYELSRSVN